MGQIAARLKAILANFSIVDTRVAADPMMPANEHARTSPMGNRVELGWGRRLPDLRGMPEASAI
jgi:hypothetical protein